MTEMQPPNGEPSQGEGQQVPHEPPASSEQPSETPAPKQPGMFVAGIITSIVLQIGLPVATGALASLTESTLSATLGLSVLSIGFVFPLVLFLVLYLVGQAKSSAKLRSFGGGGLVGYLAFTVVGGLLLFGSCFFMGF
jgi:hypothetical protein